MDGSDSVPQAGYSVNLRSLAAVVSSLLFSAAVGYPQQPGTILTIAGNGTYGDSGDGGRATSAVLDHPWRVAVDASGNVHVTDAFNSRIRRVTPAGIIATFAGNGTCCDSGDGGPATSAEFESPCRVAVDAIGNVYIADEYSDRIRKVTPAGIITTFAGNGTCCDSGDGGPATSLDFHA